MSDAAARRDAILAAKLETSNHGEEPTLETLYIPHSHLKALRLDAHVVVGGRGVGKSFWTAALQTDALRSTLGAALRDLKDVVIRIGFGATDRNEYPNPDSFKKLLDEGCEPYDIWRAVVLRWVAERTESASIPTGTWGATVDWLKQQPEQAVRLMQAPRDWRGLIVFDALDRTSDDWRQMDDIVRGLLRTALWLKAQPGLYAKVFLREDQAERTVFNFPDASKLLADKADLVWAKHDLHGLLWQRLINAPEGAGECMRLISPAIQQGGLWNLPDEMKRESEIQRNAFEALAGPWMGRDRRRGVPYVWAVGHLADGRGQTSPRSFIAAIKQAAEDSRERYQNYEYALHYESIKRGIQQASTIRVDEVAEDYPWVKSVLDPLAGMNVPCAYDDISARWRHHFPNGVKDVPFQKLPAQHLERGWDGIRDDLQRLGLIETKKDGRIDMPDLYRVGFGLGRRGGVKPKG